MLNKFENSQSELPPDDPRFVLMNSWARVVDLYRQNFEGVRRVLNAITMRRLRSNSEINYAVEAENQLASEFPELAIELQRLKRVLDFVEGWHVTWRHYELGEIIGAEVVGAENGLIHARTVRSPASII